MKNIQHTPIQIILDAAEFTLEARTEKWVKNYIANREQEVIDHAALKEVFDALPYLEQHSIYNKEAKAFRQHHVRSEMTPYLRESYKIGLRMDLVVAMANYLLKTDLIASTPTFGFGRSGDLIMTAYIQRGDKEVLLKTHVILVQGAIKAWHFRYRVETELPKINAAPYLNWLQKLDKFEDEIKRKENWINRQEADRDAASAKGVTQLYRWNAEIKTTNKQIDKLKAKIAEINAANV